MRIFGHHIVLREDWASITFLVGSVGLFVGWVSSLVAGRAEPSTAFFAIPWFLLVFCLAGLVLRKSAAIRHCKVCDVEMQRIPLARSGEKQVVRCPKCGVEQATGLRWTTRHGRAAHHKRLMGEALLDDAFGETPAKENEARGCRLPEEHRTDDV